MHRLILFSQRYNDHKTWNLLHIITIIFVKKDCSEKTYSDFWSIFDVLFDGVNKKYIFLFFHAKKSKKTCEKHPKIMFFAFFGVEI